MSASLLHITNTDGTTQYLKKLGITGSFITWREMLCEGKTTSDVGSDRFWKNRYEFFNTIYKVSKRTFIDFTLKEYKALCNKKKSSEIVLWFNFDLYSQINMIAIISWLKRHRKGHPISLVSSSHFKEGQIANNLTDLTKNQLETHYNQRLLLTQNDIEYAHYIWQLYCANSPLRLETVSKFNPMSSFNYLLDALGTHLQRFPSLNNGLNNLENTILHEVNTHKFDDKTQLITHLINTLQNFGFTSQQYNRKISRLANLCSSLAPVKLSTKGLKVLKNELNFYSQIRNDISYLGGVKKYNFLYNNQSHKLIQITH